MKIPDYPSNREADETTISTVPQGMGRCRIRMKLSRETCLHILMLLGLRDHITAFLSLFESSTALLWSFFAAPSELLFIQNFRRDLYEITQEQT